MSGDRHPHSYPPIEATTIAASPTSLNDSQIEPPASLWPQFFTTVAATTGGLIMGTAIAWSGPALHQLQVNSTSEHAEFPVSDSQANFVASLMPAGALFGGMLGGIVISRFGRKGTMIGNAVFFALSFLLLAAAQNVWMLLAGRFLSGVASGITSIASPTYVSETASSSVRGMMGSCFQLMVTFGVLFVDVLGALTTWRWMSVACIGVCLLWAFLMLLSPESPPYLLTKKDYDGAREAMTFLRGHPYIETELSEVQRSMEEAANKAFSLSQLTEPANMKPLAIALMLMVGQQLSGVNAVIFFSVSIFEKAHTDLNSYVENIIVGSVQVVATLLATMFIDKLGRRLLLVLSALVMIISLYGLGLYFWMLREMPEKAAHIDMLPLASLCIFIFAFSIGFGPIPWLMMSEIFSPEAKGVASSISATFNWTLAFFVTEFYGPVSKATGPAATFWGFATILLIVMSFTVFFVPETKGKSLEEIQEYFRDAQEEDETPIFDENLEVSIEAEINAEISTVRA